MGESQGRDEQQGWTVGKRLLQHERSGMESLVSGSSDSESSSLVAEARSRLGEVDGRIDDDGRRIVGPIAAHYRTEIKNYRITPLYDPSGWAA